MTSQQRRELKKIADNAYLKWCAAWKAYEATGCNDNDLARAQYEKWRDYITARNIAEAGRLKLVRVYEESEVEEVSVGEYRLNNHR